MKQDFKYNTAPTVFQILFLKSLAYLRITRENFITLYRLLRYVVYKFSDLNHLLLQFLPHRKPMISPLKY